jgi:3-phenylpropionate/trans-cinnamate dioxygenase alpha subunit
MASVRSFSPAGIFEQDDMQNWQECTQTCKGVVARRYPMNFQMGLGHGESHEGIPGLVSESKTETNQLYFYRHWATVMTAADWPEIQRPVFAEKKKRASR